MMLLVGALIVAIGTALLARSIFAGAATPTADAAAETAAAKGPKVLVAQRALPVGTIITADALAYQAWPKDMVQDAHFINGEADIAKLLGTVVRFAVTAGEPLTQGSLVAPGDRGFLAAALGPGMRAVTVPVSAKTGVAGFVFPGDHIDLVLTQTVSSGEGEPLRASETILRNIRVLATDQSTQSSTVDGKTVVKEFKTVTLEATPKIAEKIAVAQTIGTLSLSLRAIAAGDVSIPEGASKAEEEKLLKAAMSRPMDSATTFVTGGDVSRFQRRSMPTSREAVARQAAAAVVTAAPMGSTSVVFNPGPTVRISRGKSIEVVPVGGK